ncbi:MAG: hypothetical protein ACREAE_06610, partial [Nitrosopumilaceae archaeon]
HTKIILILTIVASFAVSLFMVQYAYAITTDPNIILTPFDISFSEKDFTKSGPSHHQILVIKPNKTASIPIKVSNQDKNPHEIIFSVLTVNLGHLPFSYSFEPSTISVAPHSEKEVLMHIQTGNTDQTTWGIIPVLAESQTFGAKGKSFYLVIGNNVTESDMEFIDVSLREGLPGPAFPNLYNDFRTQPPELQKILDSITANKFGVPRYLPNGYSFQGLTHSSSHPGFVYAPTKVTNTTESIDFVRSGGLVIGYESTNLNFNLTEWLPSYIAQNEAQEIIVNGLRGTTTEQQERVTTEGQKYKFPAQIVLFGKNSEVYLNGNIPLSELLKVAASIPVPNIENPPLILSKVELWGPSSFVAKNVRDCIENTITDLGPWAVGWIEIHNTLNKKITAEEVNLRGQSIGSVIPITLGPNESCVIQTEDMLTTRIGPGGSGGNDPPHGYGGTSVIFEYSIEENHKTTRYVDSTPEIGDTFGDTRIWQLVDGKWIFKETRPSLEDQLKQARQNIQPAKNVFDSNSPPLKQFKSGVPADAVKCREGLLLVIKSQDGSPACVKPLTYNKLAERGWANLLGTHTTGVVSVGGTAYEIPYKINGWRNKVLNMTADLEAKSFTVSIQTKNTGELTVTLPRVLIDEKMGAHDNNFIALVDGQESKIKNEKRTDTDRIFTVDFPEGSKKIEIIVK